MGGQTGGGGGQSEGGAVKYNRSQDLSDSEKEQARKNIGAATKKGEEPELVAGDLAPLDEMVTVEDNFIIRTTAGDKSINSEKDALLLKVEGGPGFSINAVRWNGRNALDPNAWSEGKTSGYLSGKINANNKVASGTHKLCIIHTPKCEVGEYGTAAKNNGWLLTDNEGNNLKVGDGKIIGVWYCPDLPTTGTEVTAVTEHVFEEHPERFYIPEEGYMIVEIVGTANLAKICAHLAWSKEYGKFTVYKEPVELILATPALAAVFETKTINGKTCLVMRGNQPGESGIHDLIIIYAEGGGYYERNLAGKLLTDCTWTETVIEQESIEGEETTVTGYRYTAPLPSTGTYAALMDGFIRSDIDGMTIEGYNLVYESPTQITPATAFADMTVDYQLATPPRGTHTLDPTGKTPDDMGTEEVVGGDAATGTIVISYYLGFRDTMKALRDEFAKASAELKEAGYTKQNYCVGAWLENANTASPNDQDDPNAKAVFGKKDWALDWRPGLVDMTAVEGETVKEPKELKKNNWFRDIYGNWSPAVGITEAMRNECMANALYTDAACTNKYCDAGGFNPETFILLCSIETVNGVKRLTHPKLYKSENTEVTHYLMPWETTETKYSIFVGRKDTVFTIDNLVGASGKEWNGILGANVSVWDGVDLEAFELKPTGICPSPVTSVMESNVAKLRSFFYNYNASDNYSKGASGASGCTLFYNNGHYHTINISQVGTKTRARANNHSATAPTPVAEGGFHARNTFLRCIETALGTKNLCHASRFSSGVSSVDACGNETQWLANGGLRYKANGAANWSYCNFAGNPAIYYGSGETKSTTNAANWLSGYGPMSKPLEAQLAVSFAVEFGIAAGEKFEFNGCTWWYNDPTATGFTPKTVADGYMNARVYKIVTGTFTGYASANATETTEFDLEVCVRTGLMLGCDMSGDGGPYWGGGCEIVGECATAPASNSFGYKLDAFIEPDQEKWLNEDNVSINIGQKFSFEGKYRYAGSVVTRANAYIRRRLANTPLPASHGGSYTKGECAYGYMGNYWGAAGKRTRVGVRFGYDANASRLSARCLHARYSAGNTSTSYCSSAQVRWRMQ